MKTKLLATGLLAATFAAVVLSPSIRGNPTNAGNNVVPPPGKVVPVTGKPKIEAVFVLDTTGSMSGLIHAAKEKIWSIATSMAQAQPAPEISIGLVAYRDRGDRYITEVVDLGTDLDSMYAALMDFAAEGGGDGPESVNRALHDAIHSISWSQDPNSYKVVFLVGDAPPHMDYQGEAQYPEIVAAAGAKGIVVNTIQCGNLVETTSHWQRIAALGNGRYFQVGQAGNAVAIATPFDDEIAALAAQLDATRLFYGTREERAAMDMKVAATQKLEESASLAVRARRGVFNASASGSANFVGEHDLVADVASGDVELEALPAAALPAPLAGLSIEEQRRVVVETAAERAKLQQRIAELAAGRDAFIAERLDETGGAADSLDRQLYEAVRSQAASKGLTYESGPKF